MRGNLHIACTKFCYRCSDVMLPHYRNESTQRLSFLINRCNCIGAGYHTFSLHKHINVIKPKVKYNLKLEVRRKIYFKKRVSIKNVVTDKITTTILHKCVHARALIYTHKIITSKDVCLVITH